MRGAAHAAGGELHLALIRLDPRHQFLHVFRRHCVLGHHQLRIGRDQRDGREVLEQVERQVVVRAVHHMRAPVSDGEGVAIGRGAYHALHADTAARAGNAFNDDGLAEKFAHGLAHQARQGIGGAARGKRHDDGDRARRVRLRRTRRA